MMADAARNIRMTIRSLKHREQDHHYKKKAQKNFVKENIQKVKGCKGCFLEKKILKMNTLQEKYRDSEKTSGTGIQSSKIPSIKYNVKIIKRENSPCKNINIERKNILSQKNLTNQSCQTDVNKPSNSEKILVNCQTCGQVIDRRNIALQTSVDEDQHSNKKLKNFSPNSKDVQQCKTKECHAKKPLDLSSYKMGVVPKYLKERNAKLEQQQKERAEQEKLAELRGLNDPKCPPGHMLMPKKELQEHIEEMETDFNELIKQLNMMPVSSDSYRVKQRKIQIEKELKELEEKIELFKNGKVFVQIPN